MRSTFRFSRLTPAERRLLAAAAITVGAVRFALWIRPFPDVGRLADRVAERCRVHCQGHSPEAIARAVAAVSRRIPRATCLVQALAARSLLARGGHRASLRLGVRKGCRGALDAHAWIQCNGRVLLAGPDLESYAAFPSPSEDTRP